MGGFIVTQLTGTIRSSTSGLGMPAQRELSSRQYPSAPVAVLKTSWSSIRKTEHQIVRNPPSTKRRSNITATR